MSAQLRCSFCGKDERHTRLLIAGPTGTFICDECVELCAKIVAEKLPVDGRWGASCADETSGRDGVEAKL